MSNSSSSSDCSTSLEDSHQTSLRVATTFTKTFTKTLLLVDAGVDRYESLAAGVVPGVEVAIVHPHEDGIEGVTRILSRYRDIEALHVVSHGSAGSLYLGRSVLNCETLDRRDRAIARWSESLAPNADILLYGCNVAADTPEASVFLNRLARLLGANVAASSTPVGNPARGGNWQLDRRIGNLHAADIFPLELQQTYRGIFIDFETRNFPVGQNPVAVALGDFNEDGNEDFAVVNRDSSTVSVLLNDGRRGFSRASSISVGALPSDVAVADLNDDGNLDLAVTNREDAQVSILLGNGNGEFSPQQTYNAGTFPRSLVVGDFDNDGNSDLAIANRDSNDVSVLLGDSSGEFTSQTTFAAGNAPFEIVSGDFNEDGNQDLAVANRDSNDVSVLISDGMGGFAPQTTFDAGIGPRGIAVGDFDKDGNQDLAVANRDSNDVSVLLGDGMGSFSSQTRFNAGSRPHSVATGDFDGDGNPDLAVANLGLNSLSVLLGRGDGTFDRQQDFLTGLEPRAVVAGDINGRGNDELVVANRVSNNVSVLSSNVVGVTVSVTAPQVEAGNVAVGTDNHVLYRLDLRVRALDTNLTDLTLTLDLGGTYQPSDLESFELFLSDDGVFDDLDRRLQTKEVVASGEDITFSGLDLPLRARDRISLFAVVDIAPDAVVGRTINISPTDLENLTFSTGDILGNSPLQGGGVQTIQPSPMPPEPSEPDDDRSPSTPSRPIIELPDSSIPPDPNYDACQLVNNLLVFPSLNLTGDTLTGATLFGDENPNILDARSASEAQMVGLAENDKLIGSAGDDLIFGNQGRDVIVTGDGTDRVFAGRENDGVNGNEGDDILAGDLGNDHILGEEGNDVIFGNAGIEFIDGGAGDDLIFGGRDNDGAIGGEGNDVILGEFGNDCLHGQAGDDELFGNHGTDVIVGGDGRNTLHGGRENDVLIGGRNSDILLGDRGNDSLRGGEGGDRFDFRPVDGSDRIADFTNNQDLIGLKDGLSFGALTIAQVGSDTQITVDGLSITLEGVDVRNIGAEDFAIVP
ncbi:MAG: FG-GAP-like repeat-containing protein [Cyanobacteriota bacterium]|nr:FG-GAP-like repeat-containing protein [Cyanobacteriota bacterium]